MLTYSHANTPLGQSERAYYLSYFLKPHKLRSTLENRKKNNNNKQTHQRQELLSLTSRDAAPEGDQVRPESLA